MMTSPPSPPAILLVDDDADASEAVALLLRRAGHDVRIATSAAEALTLMETFMPHAAIIDIGLPDMDGWSLAQQLRAHPAGRACEMVALSGFDPSSTSVDPETGFSHYLVKPVDPETLFAFLQRLV
jgi:two-component system CheB/CheR fusion protein